MLNVITLALTIITMPFTLFDNRMMVQTTLDAKPGYAMIVDTGSPGTIVTPQVAQALHLRTRPIGAVGGAGAGKLAASSAELRDIEAGGVHTGKRSVIVTDLSTIKRAFGFPRLDGVLGRDFFGPYMLLDNERHTITLSQTPIAAPGSAHRVPYVLGSDGQMHVEGAVDGVHGEMIVDTGDRWTFTLFQHFAFANNLDQAPTTERNIITGYGLGGPIRGNVLTTHLSIFGFELPDVRTRLPLGNAGAFSQSDAAGSIGNGVLKRYNILFDNVSHAMYVWPSRNAAVVAQTNAVNSSTTLPRHGFFGAAVADKPAGTTIQRVIPQTPAALAGVAVGDVIMSVAGVATPTVTAYLAQMHRHHAGERVAMLVVRNGLRKSVSAVLGAPANESDPALITSYAAILVDGTLRRTLVTYPRDSGVKLPAVLLMGGIGCYTVDAAANPQDAYMHLAHDISKGGFVTMRVEKSGVGDSQGPPCASVDFFAEERGYAAALTALRNDSHVDPSRVFLLGHSIGSLEAPRLALSQPVAGLIVAEAVGRDWPEYEVRNLRRQLELDGKSAPQTDAALLEKQQCMQRLLFQDTPEATIERTMPFCKDYNSVYPVAPPYMQQVAAVNIIDTWSKVNVPVLAVYGSSDFVTEAADHRRIVDVVNANHPSSATYNEIQGMDHLLFVAASPKAASQLFASGAARTYDADLSGAIVAWLRSHSR